MALTAEQTLIKLGPATRWFHKYRLGSHKIYPLDAIMKTEMGQEAYTEFFLSILERPEEEVIRQSIEFPWRDAEHMEQRKKELDPDGKYPPLPF